MIKIHAVIITYNTRELTSQCVAHLETELKEISAKITVGDNGSMDGTVEMLKERHPGVTLIQNGRNLGFAAACNIAFSQCPDSEFTLFVNSDTLPANGSILRMIEFMQSNPECGILGPKLVHPDGRYQNSFAAFPSLLGELPGGSSSGLASGSFKGTSKSKLLSPVDVESLVGAFMMVRTKDFLMAGSFDERYFFFLEETDLCRKIWALGKRVIYHPQIEIVHLQGASANKNRHFSRHHFFRSKYQFFQKWNGNAALATVYGINFIRSAIKTFSYTLLSFVSIFLSPKLRNKLGVSFWILKQHFKGFPPYLNKGEKRCPVSENRIDPASVRHLRTFDHFDLFETETKEGKHLLISGKKKHAKGITEHYCEISRRLYNIGLSVLLPERSGKNLLGPETPYVELNPKGELYFFDDLLKNIDSLKLSGIGTHKLKRLFITEFGIYIGLLHEKSIFFKDLTPQDIMVGVDSPGGAPSFRFFPINLGKIRFGFFRKQKYISQNLDVLQKLLNEF